MEVRQIDVFDLFAKISLDASEFESGLNQAKSKAESFAKNVSNLSSNIGKVYSGVKNVLTPVADGFKMVEGVGEKAASVVVSGLKAIGGAATVAAGGAVAIGKSAFDAYANYEQLVGGVETLFKDSADAVAINAQTAYKTAGMSANQYMELTTSFAASLLQSLDGNTEEAAKMADMAASDMADNWNKMGSSMQSVTDAYRGFAKQNYTMLDNLKLGYGGTKQEMQRLLADAEKFSGIKYDLSSYADIISAIHVIQEEMEITGTTAKEASTTIQGSVAAMKAAWENFTVGIATADYIDDFEVLTNDLVESVVTAGNNVVPRIQEIAERAIGLIPYIVQGFSEIVPEFARMGGEIVQTLADGLSAQVPALLEFGSKAIGWIADGITKNVPQMGLAVADLVTKIGDMIGSQSDKLANAGWDIVIAIFRVFTSAGDVISKYIGEFVPMIADAFMAHHEFLFTTGLDILGAIGKGIVENKEEIHDMAAITIENMVTALRDNAPNIIDGALALLEALVGALLENAEMIGETAVEIVSYLATRIGEEAPNIIPAAVETILKFLEGLTNPESINHLIDGALKLIEGLVEGLVKAVPLLIEYAPEIVANLITGIISAIPQLIEVGGQLIMGLIEGLILGALALPDAIARVVSAIVDGFKALFGIHSPSTVFAEMGENLIAGLLQGISETWESIVEFFSGAAENLIAFLGEAWDTIKEAARTAWEAIKEVFSAAWDSIKAVWEVAVDFFSGVGDGIQAVFEAVSGFLGETFSAAWEAISSVWDAAVGFFSDIWDGISSAASAAAEAVGKALEDAWDAITSIWDGAVDFFGGVYEGIVDTFSDIGSKFLEIGGNIVDGLKNGVASAWESFMGWLSGKVGGIVSAVKNMLGIHSPSTVFAGIGGNMALGLAKGWEDEYSSIKRQIEGGLNFGAASVGLSANVGGYNARGAAQNSPQTGFGGAGNTYVTINSPVAVDAITAAREWQKTTQRMAIGYV